MRYGFVAGAFVGKNPDDNTDEGLARRMFLGGLNCLLDPDTGVVWVTVAEPWEDMDEWVRKIEAHYGCVFDGTE